MRNSVEARVGLFVAIILIGIFILIEMVGGLELFSKGTNLDAYFKNAQELKLGDPVKIAGVTVGRVESIALDGSRVKVGMKIRKGVEVRTDTEATIRFSGLLGQNYISLDFGTATAPLATDQTPLKTTEQPDLASMLAKLDKVATGIENITRTFPGDKIDNLLGPLTDFIKQARDPISETVSNLSRITGQIASGEGTVGKMISDQSFYNSALTTVTNLQSAGDDIRIALADARKTMQDISAGQGTLGRLIKDDTLFREATNALGNAREALEKVNRGSGTIGLLVNDPTLFRNANLTLQKVDKATESLEDQGVLTVLGIAVGKLF